ncbi:hypothetical protein FG386_002466 [Cryptosporidium ryanae]|uniref:uncharacterized protein n=1 Tax=Cryptosporidium ryanae TaxID=515981 RepID=UPI00351A00E3|nr:hypothetical protein FG386_002466 [Cryptosporidium ryanae]
MKSSYTSELQVINASVSHRTRIYFILLCLISNLSRTASIILLDITSSGMEGHNIALGEENEVIKWYRDILRTFPSLIYLSSYSVVVLFWAHVYYSSTFTNSPHVVTLFLLGNTLVYGIYASGIIASFFKPLKNFRVLTLLIISLTYIIVAILLFYYGLKVTVHLSRRASTGTMLRYNVIKRVLLLTIFCPALLLIRGLISGIQCFYSFSNTEINFKLLDRTPIGDTFVFILTELIPSVIVIMSFWQKITPSTLIVSNRGLELTPLMFNQVPYINENQIINISSVQLNQNLGLPNISSGFLDK